jgi:CubicO group peptidase (beta-lactamase class C family)
MCSRLLLGVAALHVVACATAGPARGPATDISSVLEPLRVAGALPGMAAAVVKGDTLVALGAAGVRKHGDPSPVGLEDAWHLGSDTKAMTATLVGIAVDGRLSFDATLPSLFPGAPIDPGSANVTVEALLQW